jgi:Sec-independent protein translocase protein TatA
MFAYSSADWLFIGFILVVIFAAIKLSDIIQRKKR